MCILVKETIRFSNTAAAATSAYNGNTKVIFKSSDLVTDCMSEINNTQVENANDIDVVMLMYNTGQHKI